MEVLDHWKDAGLTAGERDDLIVLAENANDRSRLTWGPVHAPYILKRANKSAPGWKNAVGKLLRKKVLTQHVPGRVGQVAVYHLMCLCPEPPHDGYQGFCTRPERVTSQVTHPEDQTGEGHLSDDPEGHTADDPKAEEGHLSDDERVTGEMTPTPLLSSFKSPSDTPSSSVAEDSSEPIEGVVIEGGGGGDSSNEFIKQAYVFVDALDYRGKVPGRKRRTTLAMRAVAAFEAGWTEQTLADYLDLGGAPVNAAAAVYEHRLREDELPEAPTPLAAGRALPPACSNCLDEHPGAQTNLRLRIRGDGQPCPDCHPSVVGTKDSSDGGMWDRAMDRARNRMATDNWQGTGTDDRVAGWMSLAADSTEREAMLNSPTPRPSTTDQRVQQAIDAGKRLQARHDAHSGGYQPARVNDVWDRVSEEATNGLRPDGADGIPHCGECDEYTRTRGDGHSLCPKCHPVLRF
ncbi:hypothetical protein ACFVU4_27920 [Streptomyces sp. NPDC058107]|uniref:hypothetical protein n=1 Tax=Streptomyces sp. NPDC058107 TaxID=3346343 RepID=UPI0036EE6E81